MRKGQEFIFWRAGEVFWEGCGVVVHDCGGLWAGASHESGGALRMKTVFICYLKP